MFDECRHGKARRECALDECNKPDDVELDLRVRPRNRTERAAVEQLRRRHPGIIVEVPHRP